MIYRHRIPWGLAAALAVSAFFHLLAVGLLSWPRAAPEQQTSFLVQLISSPKGQASPAGQVIGSGPGQASIPVSGHEAARNGQVPVAGQALNDQGLDRILSAVHDRLQPLWEAAHPPGPGRIEVDLQLTPRGTLASVWITQAEGPPELADFVVHMVKQAGSFPRAKDYIHDRVVVGCTFIVHQ